MSPQFRETDSPREVDQPDAAAVLQDLSISPGIPIDTEAPLRILAKHREALETSLDGMPDAELAAGQKLDPRVSELQQNLISSYYIDAQLELLHSVAKRQKEEQLKVLFGPTSRVVDHVVNGRGIAILIDRICAEGNRQALVDAIANGPAGGEPAFEPPSTPVELTANLLRWAALRGSDKKRFRASDAVRGWVANALKEAGYDTEPRLGGVSAVGAALADVLGRAPTMISLGALPAELSGLLNPDMSVIGSEASAKRVADLPLDAKQVGNFCVSGRKQPLALPEGFETLRIEGKEYATKDLGCIDVIISGAKSLPGFSGLARDRLEAVGRDHKLMILTGTKDLVDAPTIEAYFDSVSVMHTGGMNAGLLYTETKEPSLEPQIWRELRNRRCVEFFSLNTSEAFDVLTRILEDTRGENVLGMQAAVSGRVESALATGGVDSEPWETGRENPAWIFQSAALLQEILEVPVVRVRGKHSDVTVTTGEFEEMPVSRIRNNLIASRHNGTLKTANPTGLIDQDGELGLLRDIPSGKTMAALHVVSDEVRKYDETLAGPVAKSHNGLSELALTCYARLADGRHCFAIPPVDFYDKSGGTQSAGDTIDVTFVTEEAEGIMQQARRVVGRFKP